MNVRVYIEICVYTFFKVNLISERVMTPLATTQSQSGSTSASCTASRLPCTFHGLIHYIYFVMIVLCHANAGHQRVVGDDDVRPEPGLPGPRA